MLLTAQFSVDCGLVCICICISIFSVDRDLVRDQSNAAGRLKDDSRVEAGLCNRLCKVIIILPIMIIIISYFINYDCNHSHNCIIVFARVFLGEKIHRLDFFAVSSDHFI